MLYHYVLTVQSRRRRWGRRCAHTVSGHAQIQGQLVQKLVYDRVFTEVVKTNELDPARTTCLFYRLSPEFASMDLGDDPPPYALDVDQPAS